jgi:hypothetical protein
MEMDAVIVVVRSNGGIVGCFDRCNEIKAMATREQTQ